MIFTTRLKDYLVNYGEHSELKFICGYQMNWVMHAQLCNFYMPSSHPKYDFIVSCLASIIPVCLLVRLAKKGSTDILKV